MLFAKKLKDKFNSFLSLSNGTTEQPFVNKNFESSIKNIYIIGDLAGAPVIKYAMQQGHNVIEHIASSFKYKNNNASLNDGNDDVLDIIIAGAGAAGLNAALSAKAKNFSFLVLEKNQIASTIKNFPEGKWIYSEPDDSPTVGYLWFDGARKEDIINKWQDIIKNNDIPIKTNEALEKINKQKDYFTITTSNGNTYKARKIIIATGKRGLPKELNVPGERQDFVYHNLYSPKMYSDKTILVVGGGNSAVEAAIALSLHNKVFLSYRKNEFLRLFKDNKRLLEEQIAKNKIELILNSTVKNFGNKNATLTTNSETKVLNIDFAFILIGSVFPKHFLRTLGISMENDWSSVKGNVLLSAFLTGATLFGLWLGGGYSSLPIHHYFGFIIAFIAFATLLGLGFRGNRYAFLFISFFIVYSIYGIKYGPGAEFWPYKSWGYNLLSFENQPWSFWYTVFYTLLMLIFGIKAMIRWGINHKDQFHIWRYISLISFQVIFFFLIPEFLFQWALEGQWFGTQLSSDKAFAEQSFRAYGIVYAWPLFFNTFFYDPHIIWIVWGVFLSFVLIPILTIWNGKRYCSWICGCGGLAETLGDDWRHLAPKGKASIKWEKINLAILIFAVATTLFMLLKDIINLFNEPASYSMAIYQVLVDVWFAGILPITLYPFLGGRIWCRYLCPLAKLMELSSAFFSKIKKLGFFRIKANNKCITCGECSKYCQMGIDVMSFALKQESITNLNSSCIGCGICITACPMDVLSFKK